MKNLTIEQAKELAEGWQAQRDERDKDQAIDSYFDGESPDDLINYWETGHGPSGGKLTGFQVAALVAAWIKTFGCHPPSTANQDSVDMQRAGRR